jgi:NMT1-like family
VDELSRRYGDFYISAEIEAGRYDGVDQPVKVVAVPNYLVVNRSMDPELAYRLTRLLFDQEALAEVHPSARRLELDTAPKVAPWSCTRAPSAPTTSRPRREDRRARGIAAGLVVAGDERGRQVASVPPVVDRHRAGTPHPGRRRPPAAPVRGRPGPDPARPHRPLTATPGGG